MRLKLPMIFLLLVFSLAQLPACVNNAPAPSASGSNGSATAWKKMSPGNGVELMIPQDWTVFPGDMALRRAVAPEEAQAVLISFKAPSQNFPADMYAALAMVPYRPNDKADGVSVIKAIDDFAGFPAVRNDAIQYVKGSHVPLQTIKTYVVFTDKYELTVESHILQVQIDQKELERRKIIEATMLQSVSIRDSGTKPFGDGGSGYKMVSPVQGLSLELPALWQTSGPSKEDPEIIGYSLGAYRIFVHDNRVSKAKKNERLAALQSIVTADAHKFPAFFAENWRNSTLGRHAAPGYDALWGEKLNFKGYNGHITSLAASFVSLSQSSGGPASLKICATIINLNIGGEPFSLHISSPEFITPQEMDRLTNASLAPLERLPARHRHIISSLAIDERRYARNALK